MVTTLQTFVQRRFHGLMMAMIGFGFVLLFLELLIGYQHYHGLQLIGLATTVIGAIVSFLGIGATGSRRWTLAILLLGLSLAGVLGTFLHNGDRLEGREGPPAAQSERGTPPQRPPEARDNGRPIPPPILAPLSLSGFCILGAVALLGRKDE
jgi:hypothetical protein